MFFSSLKCNFHMNPHVRLFVGRYEHIIHTLLFLYEKNQNKKQKQISISTKLCLPY